MVGPDGGSRSSGRSRRARRRGLVGSGPAAGSPSPRLKWLPQIAVGRSGPLAHDLLRVHQTGSPRRRRAGIAPRSPRCARRPETTPWRRSAAPTVHAHGITAVAGPRIALPGRPAGFKYQPGLPAVAVIGVEVVAAPQLE